MMYSRKKNPTENRFEDEDFWGSCHWYAKQMHVGDVFQKRFSDKEKFLQFLLKD